MTQRPFVHLHCHSHYSLLDGASRVPELVACAKAQGMNAIALTDHGNLYGAIEFYSECKNAGINPVLGYEAYIAAGKRTEKEARRRGEAGFHLTLLAKNRQGFKNLTKLASHAFLDGYHYVPRIDKELLREYHEGIICLSGCASGEFSEFILRDQLDEATKLAQWFHGLFENDFYVEIQNNGLEIQRRCAEGAIDIARRLGLPLVATSDAHYLCQADSDAHDVLLCINTGKLRSDVNRMKYGSNKFYVRGPEEMYELFPGHEDAVKRSQEIADQVDVQIDFKARHFPVFTPPAQKTPEKFLRELCLEGMTARYGATPSQAAQDRLELELGVITRMGFASYFLIVWDFVYFAKTNGIPASARGSACGAVVSYVLQLSDVDPLEYDLLFERFLDPNRSEAPDIDIDFCQDRREEVIAYVKQKYGEASVAQIATFGTMAARAAIKDVGRVLDVPLERVNQITAMIPKTLGITLDESLAQSTDLKKAYDTDSLVHELIDIARKLEGTNRNAGTHAAGVVIANGPLTDYVPLQRVVRKGEDGGKRDEIAVTTQWVMGDLEKVGMLKMDFLGLRTLTMLENALQLIKLTRGVTIDLLKLPIDDRDTYALLSRGDARGVFQFESDGIRELLKRMKPDNIRDIIASTALYRPGPLQGGMVDSYINCKHGREKPEYPHQVMRDILTETHGVMVFQEQVMRILNQLGGIELSSAYACIKAISKKKYEIIDKRRVEFIAGAQERGVSEEAANDIFERIVFFGGYGFNKSHSAAYALLSYQTAYLKTHYTAEFMAALLSSEIEDGNKRDIMIQHLDDCRKMKVEVLGPNVNSGDVGFTVADGRIVFGLTAIKGVGRGAVEALRRGRTDTGKFKDLFDFCERVDLKIIGKAAIERLIKAGAFDCFNQGRAPLMNALPRAVQAAGEVQLDRRHGQGNLFATLEDEGTTPVVAQPDLMVSVAEWTDSEKLKYEKEALDFYLSSHPLAQREDEIRRFASHAVDQLGNLGPNQDVILGGMLTQVRYMNTKKARNGNSRYVRCKVEDMTGAVECVMWPDDFVRYKDEIAEDRVCFVKGAIDERSNREEPVLILTRVFSVEQAQREQAKDLWLQVRLNSHNTAVVDAIGVILRRSPGAYPVFLDVRDPFGKRCVVRLGDDYRINSQAVSVADLETLLGAGSVKFSAPGNSRR